jgi:hypothetical protein
VEPTLDTGGTYAVLGTKHVMSDHCRDGWIAEVGNRVVRLASLNGNIAGRRRGPGAVPIHTSQVAVPAMVR